MDAVIRTEGLTKHYRDVAAVNDVSLSVGRGEVYGFLGLNGAGKTTTIRMLLGMARPTAGAAFLDGRRVDPGNYTLWSEVGAIVETPHAYPHVSVRENLEIVRALRGIRWGRAVEDTMERLGIARYADRKAKTLSLGNAQRLGLAKALLHAPAILILDEPSNGLDPAGIVEVRDLLRDYARQGGTVFISSHILGEIARLATRIGIIHDGRLLRELDSAELGALLGRRLLVDARDRAALGALLREKGITAAAGADGWYETSDADLVARPDALSRMMAASGIHPTRLAVEQEDLETFFLRTIGKEGDPS